jgi:hypothetical protein
MWKSEYDYDPEKDGLPRNATIFIVIASVIAALYLAFVLV